MAHLPRQDMPPQGGFASFSFHRNLPKKGFSSLTILAGATAISVIGMGQWITAQKKINQERLARIEERHLFLQKLDKHMYQRYLARVERQAELDVIAMDKLIKGEKFKLERPLERSYFGMYQGE